jgi:FkbM family methyltransferase
MLKKILENIKYFPTIVTRITNWFSFCLHYLKLIKSVQFIVKFRKGFKICTSGPLDVSTVAVIFIKDNYGKICDNSIIIDIGANIGAFSIYAATTSNHSTIYAYEPFPDNFDKLNRNIQINNLSKAIRTFKLGVASKKGTRKFYLGDTLSHSLSNDHKGSSLEVEINCISLEDIFTQNDIDTVDILKLDCEGAEFEILYDAPSYILQRVREIRMEYHNQRKPLENIEKLIEFMEKMGKFMIFFEPSSNGYTGNVWFK